MQILNHCIQSEWKTSDRCPKVSVWNNKQWRTLVDTKHFCTKWMENKHGRNGPTGGSVDKRRKYFRNSKRCEKQNLGQRGLRFQDWSSFIVSQEKVQGGRKFSAGLIFLVCYRVWIHCFFWQCVSLARVVFFFCCILLVFWWEIEEK